MTRAHVVLLALPLLAACQVPGVVTVPLPVRDVRMDVAVDESFRVAIDQRRALMSTIAIDAKLLEKDGSGDTSGRVLLRAEDWNAWVNEFERELVRHDVRVLHGGGATPGAAATFHVHLLEVIPVRTRVDLEPLRLRRHARGRKTTPIEEFWLEDFVCHVDAKLVLAGGVVAWSGEVFVPASSLIAPGTPTLEYRVEHATPTGPQVLVERTDEQPNPSFNLEWAPIVHELMPTGGLPDGFDDASPEFVRAVTKVAARQCVAALLHAELPGGEGGF